MPVSTSKSNNYATHDDLNLFRQELISDFRDFRNEISDEFRSLRRDFSGSNQTNWSVVIAGFSIFLLMSGMAATLVSNQFTSTKDNFAEIINRLDSKTETIKQSIVSNENASNRYSAEVVKRLDDKIAVNTEGTTQIDTILQREMRLLDEILQREMGLHVARLEALIEVNADSIGKIENQK